MISLQNTLFMYLHFIVKKKEEKNLIRMDFFGEPGENSVSIHSVQRILGFPMGSG